MSIELSLKLINGKAVFRAFRPDDDVETVRNLVQQLEMEGGVPKGQRNLIFKGRRLDNGKKLSDYGIKEGDTLQSVMVLKG